MKSLVNEEIIIEGVIGATVTMPQNPTDQTTYPAVLIIPGTGNIDRDGNVKRENMQLNLYRDVAQYITSLGFVTLRYDKRGVGKSKGVLHEASMSDLVDDAKTALQFLRNHPNVYSDQVFILGHSEGTILATAVNAQNLVSGLILLSGAGSKLNEAITYQQELAYAELKKLRGFKGFIIRTFNVVEKARKKNDAFMEKALNSNKDVIRVGLDRVSRLWLKEHYTYDLFEDYTKITCPVLAITGKRDIQADYKALENLPKYITSPLETYAIENMNHGLKEQTKAMSILQAKKGYKEDIGKELHHELKSVLKRWLKNQVRA